jgi:hypothetical protein
MTIGSARSYQDRSGVGEQLVILQARSCGIVIRRRRIRWVWLHLQRDEHWVGVVTRFGYAHLWWGITLG